MSKKVLILSEPIGAGHTKAAEALVQGISYLAPSIETKVLEMGHLLHPFTTKFVFQLYLKLIIFFPALWRKIYQHHQDKPLAKWKKYMIYQLFYRNIEHILDQEQPHLIICTHSFSSVTMSRMKKKGYAINLCVAITDFHVHGVWVHPEVDVYLVANEEVYDQLISMGVSKSKILVTGMPIRADFWTVRQKDELKRQLGLLDMPTVMLMGGGLGLGGIKQLSHALLKWKEQVQIIICTGSNDKLRNALLKDHRFLHPHIQVLGFVDEISDWMEAVDFLITKSGGLTCFEALFKKLPLCIYQPISGHEEKNCDFLVGKHLAIRIEEIEQINHWIEKLLDESQELVTLRHHITQFQQKIDPLAGAKYITDLLVQDQFDAKINNKLLPPATITKPLF